MGSTGSVRNPVGFTVATDSPADFLLPENAPPPARACFAVDKLPKGGVIEIECVAIL